MGMDAARVRWVSLFGTVCLLAAMPAAGQTTRGGDDWAIRFAQAERLRRNRATSDVPAPRPATPASMPDSPPIAPPAESVPVPIPAETPQPSVAPPTAP